MNTLWKLSPDGKTASRTLANGDKESRFVTSINAAELATAIPADPISLVSDAQAALDFSDKVAWRCFKAGVSYPAAWLSVDKGLRAIVFGTDKTSTVIPAFPTKADGSVDYPAGT